MKSFLITSSGTFLGIIAADHASRDFEAQQSVQRQWYQNREQQRHQAELASMGVKDRIFAYAREEKYKIIGASWVASMIGSFMLVSRNKYLSGPQKLVQARVYAQGLTVAVLCATAAFEIADQKRGRGLIEAAKRGKSAAEGPGSMHEAKEAEKKKKAAGDNEIWKEMVAAEESRLKRKHQSLYDTHGQHGHAEAKEEEEQGEKGEEKEEDENGEGDQKQKKGEKKSA